MWLTSLFKGKRRGNPPLYLYNTLGRSKQIFTLPKQANAVRMYNCGPTVYDTQHIGNLSMFVFTDVLRRVLEYNGYKVKQVINITDVGHLTSDADIGDDKMAKGLMREGKEMTLENMLELGEKYTKTFLNDLSLLNIDIGKITFPRASAYIPAQIAMVKTLEEKGYGYPAKTGVYFDTTRFPSYGALGDINLDALKAGARVAVSADKRNPADFLLWKLDEKIGWDSPWGKGFPGWHIECSAMIRSTLGEQIDIHTGGIEHIQVHHNNEIAQSEAATGRRPLCRFWMHRAHIQIEDSKIAKSEGNVVYLSDIVAKGIHPFALRYLFLGAHYRTPSNFSWEALSASETAFLRLRSLADSLPKGGVPPESYRARMHQRINDDLDISGALAVVWEMIKDQTLRPSEVRAGLIDADRVFGLGLTLLDEKTQKLSEQQYRINVPQNTLEIKVVERIKVREEVRLQKDWTISDTLRKEIKETLEKGDALYEYEISDTRGGTTIAKIRRQDSTELKDNDMVS